MHAVLVIGIVVLIVVAFGYYVMGITKVGGLVALGITAAVFTGLGILIKNIAIRGSAVVSSVIGEGEDSDMSSLKRIVGDEAVDNPGKFAEKYHTLPAESQIHAKFLLNHLGKKDLLAAVSSEQ